MANLRANKITSTEVFDTTGSVQFDGSTGYLSLADSEDFNFGSGDFTVEGWMYLIGSGEAYLLGQANSAGADSSGCVAVLSDSSNNLVARVFQSSGSYNELTHSVISKAVWNHFALVRSGSTLFLYLNGVSVQISIGSITLNNSTNQLGIGRLGEYTSKYFNGHISNLRILKGTALYTKNFTPPFRELEVIPNTVLLCAQSKTRANEERTGKTITVNGNAVASELTPGLLTNVVKSGGSSAITGSVEFSGSSWLQISDNNDFTFGSNSFTVEGWFNLSKDSTGERWILGQLPSSGNPDAGTLGSIGIRKLANTEAGFQSQLQGDLYSTTGQISVRSGTASTITSASDWTHFAFVRDGNNMKMYVNGIGSTATDVTGLSARDATGNFSIGRVGDYANNGWKGFLSNIRIINGTALYTQNFIPPARRLTRLPGTVLLCCTDSGNPLKEETGKTILLNGTGSTYSVGIGTTTPNPSKFVPQVSTDGTVTFDGATKINTPNYFYLPTGPTEQRSRGRGVLFGAYTSPASINTIQYISIQSTGVVQKFGELSQAASISGAVSSSTRGISAGGFKQPSPAIYLNNIDYVTISSTSNSSSFGTLAYKRAYIAGLSNSTRGVFVSGYNWDGPAAITNTIDYVTIATTGNTTNFGNATAGYYGDAGACSSVRGLFAGANQSPGAGYTNRVEYVTIASTGNSIYFGDLTVARRGACATSSPTRAIFAGGYIGPASQYNTIDYVTISSTGNTTSFGSLTFSGSYRGSTSNSIRGVFINGYTPSLVNTIDYITIATTGNAIKFGDSFVTGYSSSSCSDSHGGLG